MTELRQAAEAVIALVPVAKGRLPTQWQRNNRNKAQVAIARLREAVRVVEGP